MDTILFDLDGTLLPMNLDNFTKIYFQQIGLYFSDLIDGKELIGHILQSTEVMVSNNENKTNEEIFMEDFKKRISGDVNIYKERFDTFYDSAFLKAKESVFNLPVIKESVKLLKQKGYNLVIATNPLFPLKAILHRIEWAGLNVEDFIYVSSYEKNHFCKPSEKFYEEILKEIGKTPAECLMVGNDVQEDLVAGNLGIKTFLIDNYLLHRTSEEVKSDYRGCYEDFYEFVKLLPQIEKAV